jgi:ABC-type transport system involved in multi-copper enzyme maturation permease subunit
MRTLLRKDVRLSRLPLIVSVALLFVPYFAVAAMLYQVYAPDLPSRGTIADYVASAAVFGLMFSAAGAGLLAGNIVACERADGSAVFLACQPVSHLQVIVSKLGVVAAGIGLMWLVHTSALFGIAPLLATDARPFMKIDAPVGFAAAVTVVTTGVSWFASILTRSPSLAISAGLGAAFLVPWFVYLVGLWIDVAPDDLTAARTFTQWAVGSCGLLGGTYIYVKRVEP